ncbi:MAG: four helix bundle protein [Pyrinomonadaceae bacterium]
MQDFRNLTVWRRAHELALLIYRVTTNFPRDELFGLRNSLRKTSVDIPALIAEGCGKPSDAEFSRSIGAALALANRLEYYALMAHDLKFIGPDQHAHVSEEIVEVKKMLNGFNRRLA